MFKFDRLTVLFGVDHTVADTGQLSVLVNLYIILFQMLKQTCLRLRHGIRYDLRRHLYHSYITALDRKEHRGFGTGHAATGHDDPFSGKRSAAQNINSALDKFFVIKAWYGKNQRRSARGKNNCIRLFCFYNCLRKRCAELYLNSEFFKLTAIVDYKSIVLRLARRRSCCKPLTSDLMSSFIK